MVGRKVSFAIGGRWIPTIIAHLFHVVKHSPAGDYRVAWWKSIANHIVDVHIHSTSIFPACLHGPQKQVFNEEGDELVVGYIEPGKFKKVIAILWGILILSLNPDYLKGYATLVMTLFRTNYTFIVDSELHQEMLKILLDPNIIEAVNRAGEDTTSELESFHSCLNRNAPKMVGFSYSGMLTR